MRQTVDWKKEEVLRAFCLQEELRKRKVVQEVIIVSPCLINDYMLGLHEIFLLVEFALAALSDTNIEEIFHFAFSGAGEALYRWSWPPLLRSLLFTLLLAPCFCSLLFLVMLCEGRRSRRRTRRGPSIWLSVLVLSASLPYLLFCSPAMSREESPTAAVLCFSGVNSVEPLCYRRRTSHTDGFVQALQSAMEHNVHHLSSLFLHQGRAESKIFSGFAPLHFRRQIRSIFRPDPILFGKSSTSLNFRVMCSSTTLQPCFHLLVNLVSDVGGNPLRHPALSHLFVNLVSDVGGNPLRRPALSHQKLVRSCCPSTTLIFSSVAESISLPCLFSMNGENFSDSFLSFSFSLLTGLLPCGAVCTGPEGAIETTSVFLVGEDCFSTSLVTIFQLSDFVVKAFPTHSSTISNSLSSSVEDLSRLAYLCIAFYAYGQRGWIIPSFYCMEED
ncbi:hypothetical protein IGI04_023911 [Brassica rapa subsp. trilocularis]|uniref:Uncharacterized protein n=1 Tax=Brassica rapa subsp. trilocularis TaxID=1813537 RepID=A0ABQ7M576_BRACM|nr:hypothetical protein IGI04_023911 [Brassica rapa subsp. trilocularis]